MDHDDDYCDDDDHHEEEDKGHGDDDEKDDLISYSTKNLNFCTSREIARPREKCDSRKFVHASKCSVVAALDAVGHESNRGFTPIVGIPHKPRNYDDDKPYDDDDDDHTPQPQTQVRPKPCKPKTQPKNPSST